MTDWTARRNDSESGSLRKDGRMSAKDRPVFFTDIPDPWAGRLAVASSVDVGCPIGHRSVDLTPDTPCEVVA